MTKDNSHIALHPVLHPWINQVISRKDIIFEEIKMRGSPLNIHSLIPFEENILKFREIFVKYGLKHKIYFARKANKCLSFAQKSVALGQGADTASYRELRQCLDTGILSKDLILTAAVKNRKLLELAIEREVAVILDNRDEFELLHRIAREKDKLVYIHVRVGGFEVNGKPLPSRFGFSPKEALVFITQTIRQSDHIRFQGLQFHLNGYSVHERAIALEQCIGLVDHLKSTGIITYSMDIGGGFLVNYLKSVQQWKKFHRELKKAVLEQREEITYHNDPLGMVEFEGELHGEPAVYPYWNENPKEKFLESILTTISKKYSRPLYELIRERKLELRIEPGRSLLDQAGITVATVAFRKKDSEGNILIGLEMNRTQLRSSSADFLLDPIHISRQSNSTQQEATYGYLVGAYCLEQELILKRKIRFTKFPEPGDLIVFPNTAGYMTHFFESEAHMFELAKNVFYNKLNGFRLSN